MGSVFPALSAQTFPEQGLGDQSHFRMPLRNPVARCGPCGGVRPWPGRSVVKRRVGGLLGYRLVARPGGASLPSDRGALSPHHSAEVQAVLLTDILIFLQEKDQKYVFASLVSKWLISAVRD